MISHLKLLNHIIEENDENIIYNVMEDDEIIYKDYMKKIKGIIDFTEDFDYIIKD